MADLSKFCQSCSMPMDQDPNGGGTEKDGSKSIKYCSYCYKDGEFTDDFTDSSQMTDFVKEKLREQGIKNPLKLWFYTSLISKLERWQK